MERILKGGPWTFDNQALMLRRWQKGMTATNVKLETVSLWVQIWGAPFDMLSPKVAAEVGSRLGVVEEVEMRQKQEYQNLFMRVKVALPILKPIQRGGYIAGLEGVRTWVLYKYERLPIFCHFCGLLGHDIRHCAGYFAASKKGGNVVCEYGDWLKSMGGRAWSPPKRGRSRYPFGEKVTTEKQGCSDEHQSPVTDIDAIVNHTAQETSIKDRSGESITGSEFKVVNAESSMMYMGVTGVTDDLASKCGVVNSGKSNNAEVSEPVPTAAKHVLDCPQDGPDKTKPKWTRLQRMECGPIDNTSSAKSTLGKRRFLLGLEEDSSDSAGAVAGKTKRGRKQDGSTNNEAAGVLEHPCRS